MRWAARICDAGICLTFVWFIASPVVAQNKRVPWNRTGVDSIILNDGTRLFGLVDGESEIPAWAFVDRQWIRLARPELALRLAEQEAEAWARRKPLLLDEIDAWIARRHDSGLLVSFLRDERARIEQIDESTLQQLAFLTVPVAQIRRFSSRPPQQRRIAALAWQFGLRNVVTTSVADLQRELKKQGVDTAQEPINLIRCLPPMTESPDAWAARVALVEYQYHESLEYHGTRNRLWSSDAEMSPELLLGSIMDNSVQQLSQLGQELGLPEFRQDPSGTPPPVADDRKAIEAARQRGLNGVLVIRLWDQTSAHVETRSVFHARLNKDRWVPVFRSERRFSLADVRPEEIEALRQNDQIRKAIKTVGDLGLPVDESRLNLALRHGVATQTALRKARESFGEFMQPHVERLETFPVVLK